MSIYANKPGQGVCADEELGGPLPLTASCCLREGAPTGSPPAAPPATFPAAFLKEPPARLTGRGRHERRNGGPRGLDQTGIEQDTSLCWGLSQPDGQGPGWGLWALGRGAWPSLTQGSPHPSCPPQALPSAPVP